jgi:hypothetical protein
MCGDGNQTHDPLLLFYAWGFAIFTTLIGWHYFFWRNSNETSSKSELKKNDDNVFCDRKFQWYLFIFGLVLTLIFVYEVIRDYSVMTRCG